jgi:hypothetical protein
MKPIRVGSSFTKRLASTERSGKRLSSWNTIPMRSAWAAVGVPRLTTAPSSEMVPLSADSTPARIFISDDFPAPFSPTTA